MSSHNNIQAIVAQDMQEVSRLLNNPYYSDDARMLAHEMSDWSTNVSPCDH